MSMPEMKYLVLSTENWCIYTMTPTPFTANALAEGDGDSIVRGLTPQNSADHARCVDRAFFYNKIWMIDNKKNTFVEVDPNNVSDSWKKQREILFLRQNAFVHWETHISNSLVRMQRHKWEAFDSYMWEELKNCDPTINQFSKIVEEYARILEIPVDMAYGELKLRIESDNSVRFRIQAMAEKWKRQINRGETQDELKEIRKQMTRDFWQNCLI